MKLFVSILVVCLVYAICDAKILNRYGDITSDDYIGKLHVFAAADHNGHIRRNVTFPKESTTKYMIRGFDHLDYEERSPSLKFHTQSGLFEPSQRVSFEVVSEFGEGLTSIFRFYGEEDNTIHN